MKQYIIVQNFSAPEAEKKINSLISDGYEPIGGLFTSNSGGHFLFTQAMILRTEPQPEYDYYVCHDKEYASLHRDIEKYLKRGYKRHGNIRMAGGELCQGMILGEPPAPKLEPVEDLTGVV